MSETFRIEIPLDADGFADLQCPHCGERFRLRPEDYSTDEGPKVFCPFCGLPQDIHFSDEIMDYAKSVAKAKAQKAMARALRGFGVAGLRHPSVGDPPVPNDGTLRNHRFDCCGRRAKINPLTIISEPYCPYCGDRPMTNLELKRITREFHLRASQLANTDWRSYGSALGAFLLYIKGVPCLMDFIRSCGTCSRDWNAVLNKETDLWQSGESDFSADPKIKAAELFSFLEFLVDNKVDIIGFSFHYDIGANCPGAIRAFHKAVPGLLIEELGLHLQSLADESEEQSNLSARSSININNANQVNVASDHASIQATMTVDSPQIGELVRRLDDLLESAKRELPDASDDIQASVDDAKQALREGTTWGKAKKLFLAIKGCVCDSGTLAKAVLSIMDLAQKTLPL